MKQDLILLDNNIFDDGSIECKNFLLCSKDEAYNAETDNTLIQKAIDLIKAAMKQGKHYVNVKNLGLVYEGRYYDDSIIEIQWD